MENADIGDGSPRANDIDLSRVSPLRRAEVSRRIETILDYLRLPTPSDADRAAAAGALGIGAQQFMNLVRAWVAHGEAVAIAKAGANAGAARSPRRRGLPPATRVAAEDALRKLPATASHKEAITAVRAACQRRRTRPPSDSMVSYLRLELRRTAGSADGPEGLLVGRAIAGMPVLGDSGLELPEVALAVDTRDGTVLAVAVVDHNAKSPSAHFENAVRAHAERRNGPVTIGTDDEGLATTLPGSRIVSRFKAGRLLARTVGRGIGGVRLTYGPLASTDPERQLRAKADAPLDLADAKAAIAAAVATHNATRATARNGHGDGTDA